MKPFLLHQRQQFRLSHGMNTTLAIASTLLCVPARRTPLLLITTSDHPLSLEHANSLSESLPKPQPGLMTFPHIFNATKQRVKSEPADHDSPSTLPLTHRPRQSCPRAGGTRRGLTMAHNGCPEPNFPLVGTASELTCQRLLLGIRSYR